jgi:hypothetical protein
VICKQSAETRNSPLFNEYYSPPYVTITVAPGKPDRNGGFRLSGYRIPRRYFSEGVLSTANNPNSERSVAVLPGVIFFNLPVLLITGLNSLSWHQYYACFSQAMVVVSPVFNKTDALSIR